MRAGLLGQVDEIDNGFRATWRGSDGKPASSAHTTRREAIAQVAKLARGGPRFHDLRHSYATWLVSEGLPVNIVRAVMGHEQTSTTLDIYTHTPDGYEERVAGALRAPDAFLLPFPDDDDQEDADDDEADDA